MLAPPRPQGKTPELTTPIRRAPSGVFATSGPPLSPSHEVEWKGRRLRVRPIRLPSAQIIVFSMKPRDLPYSRSHFRAGYTRSLVVFSRRATLKPQALRVPQPAERATPPGLVAAFDSDRLASAMGCAPGALAMVRTEKS